MRNALRGVLIACALVASLSHASARVPDFNSPAAVLQWTFDYRASPSPGVLPGAVGAMLGHGLLGDDEKAGYFVGFIAGVLNANPGRAAALIEQMPALPPKEQAVLVRAIGYSRLSDWPALMVRFAPRMAHREALAGEFLSGTEPGLMARSWDDGAVVAYTLWGFYVATGDPAPVRRIISALAWTEDDDGAFSMDHVARSIGLEGDGDKQTRLDRRVIGATAKWSLVAYAEQHRELVDLYRAELAAAPDGVAGPLGDVLEAAERFEAERIRAEEMAAVEELKQRLALTGPANTRAAYAGSVGLATACVIAGALGHVEIAGTCVVTGALYSGAMKLFGW